MKYIITIFLSFTFYSSFCQQDIKIYKESNDSVLFKDFVSKIEKKYGYQFFFQKNWVDSLIIRQSKNPSTLDEILEETFSNTQLSYFSYGPKKIIISKNYNIVNGIQPSLFSSHENKFEETIEIPEPSFMQNMDEEKTQKHKNGVIIIGNPAKKYLGKTALLSGYITENKTGTPIIGAVVYIKQLELGTATDKDGRYFISIPKGKHSVLIRSIGKKEKTQSIIIHEKGTLNITLDEDVLMLKDVIISADKKKNINSVEQGLEVMNMKTIKKLPSIMGEADIIKSALLLPGIQTTGEGNSGFNVRGGNADQNLILLENSPIFNSSHLFGFYSVLNPDVIDDFKLYKSSFPSNYGGRLSSILDISVKEGDMKDYHLVGGISPMSGRLSFDGPIIKDKVSLLIAGRSSYSDWILKRIESSVFSTNEASFYDLNAKLTVLATKKDNISANAYYSSDRFKLNSDTVYSYENQNASLEWKHNFSPFFQTNISGIYSNYHYSINSDTSTKYIFKYHYNIKQTEGKLNFIYTINANHKVKFGTNIIYYNLNPGKLDKALKDSIFNPVELRKEQGVESAIYINDAFDITDKLSLNIGFRYSQYQSLGPAIEYKYKEDYPKTIDNIIDSVTYNKNSSSSHYRNPEFRLSARYKLNKDNSIKASYSNMTQYIHILSNTYAISPTDSWTLSNSHIKPQKSTQYSIGYYQNFNNDEIETSIETYYKELENLLEYRPGTTLFMNQNLETILLSGEGISYGIELMVKKKKGKFNGWFSYTYSKSLVKVDSKFKEDKINSGNYYPTNYDKPHDLTVVANYKYSRRISLSGTVVYNTGRPITYPVAKYIFSDRELVHYSDRNEYRVPNYFRIDLSLTVEGNLRLTKIAHSSWTFSVYNLTGRNNVYSIYFVSSPKKYVQGYKMSVFAQPVPTITYNFRF